jgi:DNA replication initiation complex subunit (GINS family)
MNEKIIDTLRKLINHEKSAREIGNVEEAAAFAAKIQSFIDKYNIELSEIDLTVEENDIRSETLVADCKQQWMKFLLVDIAEINGCTIVFRTAGYDVYGLPMDIELVATLY